MRHMLSTYFVKINIYTNIRPDKEDKKNTKNQQQKLNKKPKYPFYKCRWREKNVQEFFFLSKYFSF